VTLADATELPRYHSKLPENETLHVHLGERLRRLQFALPTDGQWVIDIPGWGEIEGKDFGSFLAQQCGPLVITFEADGRSGWGSGP
jgi:hypothetical protein